MPLSPWLDRAWPLWVVSSPPTSCALNRASAKSCINKIRNILRLHKKYWTYHPKVEGRRCKVPTLHVWLLGGRGCKKRGQVLANQSRSDDSQEDAWIPWIPLYSVPQIVCQPSVTPEKNISLSESRSVDGNRESLHIQSHIINHQSLAITPAKISVIPIMDENWLPCRVPWTSQRKFLYHYLCT